ncbi:MAG: hypothetical protein CVU62_08320 [Deltaproteobacteria bacterium HGW-Deltaproteobacteria-2]|nr:MAG: hypothetical protein CVU62_08320 [Deltaproteobacteria bacterium HGW-Deltaproteobacteria-2]
MSANINVRWSWLKLMYWYTILGAGGYGLLIIVAPAFVQSTTQCLMPFPAQDPLIFGYMGSAMVAFAILSIFALRAPLRFVPVLMLQLVYKTVWMLGVYIPLVMSGNNSLYATLLAAIFVIYIIGDLVAIPFSYLLGRETD